MLEAHQTVDDLAARLARVSPAMRLHTLGEQLQPWRERLDGAMRQRMTLAQRDVAALADVLAALDPQALMSRGYGFVCNADTGSGIRGISDVQAGDAIRAILHDGEIRANVIETTQGTPLDNKRSC